MSLTHNDLIDHLRSGTTRPKAVDRALAGFNRFINSQVLGGILLLICAIIAILWANSPFAESYFHLWETTFTFTVGDMAFALTLHQILNEALMMAFFLLIGLEVKEQVLVGELSQWQQALLPICAALGGMIVPALIYALINGGGEGIAGWGVPMSTDIAFALGILALLGKRVPLSLKIFLATLAVADDIGAILVITFFYTGEIALDGLLIAFLFWFTIFALGRISIYNSYIYFALSIGVWFGFFIAGIHPTIAGVIVAFTIPAHPLIEPKRLQTYIDRIDLSHLLDADDASDPKQDVYNVIRDPERKEDITEAYYAMHNITPPLIRLEHALQPWVTFIVMPLFALANAGVAIGDNAGETLTSAVSLGVILGLFIGKPLGISLFTWLAVRSGFAKLPRNVSWTHIFGVSALAGIGFTMSLFVTELAFVNQHHLAAEAKIGILVASFMAGVVGYISLRLANGHASQSPITETTPQQAQAV